MHYYVEILLFVFEGCLMFKDEKFECCVMYMLSSHWNIWLLIKCVWYSVWEPFMWLYFEQYVSVNNVWLLMHINWELQIHNSYTKHYIPQQLFRWNWHLLHCHT